MTDAEWNKERVRLTGAVTRAYNDARRTRALSAKLLALANVDIAREALRQHLLNRFELTK
jgi:hypothetical protein